MRTPRQRRNPHLGKARSWCRTQAEYETRALLEWLRSSVLPGGEWAEADVVATAREVYRLREAETWEK